MIKIRPLYEDKENTKQFYPETNIKAVLDDNGKSLDQILEDISIEVPSNISAFDNDVGYLTEHQDISNKADKSNTYTKQEVDAAIANVDVSEQLNNYYTKQEIDGAGYITDVSDKANIDDIPTKTSELTNDSGFLTQHQDISGKADKSTTYTKSEVDSKETELIDLINFKSNTNRILDDNGNSVEQRLQEQMGVINQKQLEIGAVPSDITPTAGSTNWVTSGGVYNGIRGGLKTSKYEQIPVTWTNGYYVNASNNLVEYANFSAVQNIDVSGYKKVIACVKMQASAAKYVILDENYTVLKAETKTMPQIDLASYPTAKYMSFTNQDYTYSGIIYGLKQEDTSIQDSFADYLEFGTPEENYIRSVGKEIFILPKINTGITIYTSNTTSSRYSNGKSTEFGVVPIGATKIYYTGWSYGSIAGVLFYDKYKNLISAVSGGSNAYVIEKEFSIPSGTVYYRCCSMQSRLSYYFDSMPQVVLGGESGNITTLQEMPISLTYGGYINSSNSVASSNNCYYAKDVDISEYSGKKLVIMCNASQSAMRNILLDEDYNILLSYQGIRESVDLARYPTAKYLSVSNDLTSGTTKYSGKIFVVMEAEETESELLSNYYEVYGSGSPAYAKMITDMCYVEPKADVIGYYLSTSNTPIARSTGRYTSKYYLVPPTATKIYYTGVSYSVAAGVLFYDKYKNMFKAVAVGSNVTPVTNAEVIIPSGAIYYRLSSYSGACSAYFDNPTIPVGGSSGGNDLSNCLNRKSYVAIGDSFTAPIGSEVIEEGPLAGMSKVYPYIIANRNNMTVLNQGASGSVLNGYLASARYNAIPEDVDYITIWYGINDTGHGISIGTVDDQPESVTSEKSTSTCGGFNWFFKWLLTNRPLAHIGVIITNFTAQDRREAIMACCQKWGIPYLDLYDPTIPMIRTRGNTRYTHDTAIAPLGYVEVCAEAKALRNAVFSTDPSTTNMHPNNTCHEWQSNMIENFMRGL